MSPRACRQQWSETYSSETIVRTDRHDAVGIRLVLHRDIEFEVPSPKEWTTPSYLPFAST